MLLDTVKDDSIGGFFRAVFIFLTVGLLIFIAYQISLYTSESPEVSALVQAETDTFTSSDSE